MTKYGRLLGTVGAAALAVVGASPAFAAGTAAGSTITNTVTVNYQVGGVSQTATGASNTFTVDRKVNLTVAEVGNSTTQVSPGQTAAVTTFLVTNTSNATLDFALAAVQQAGGAAPHGGTDSFQATNVKIYVDTNANGTYDSGTDTEGNGQAAHPADEVRRACFHRNPHLIPRKFSANTRIFLSQNISTRREKSTARFAGSQGPVSCAERDKRPEWPFDDPVYRSGEPGKSHLEAGAS